MFLAKEELHRLYWVEGMTQTQIAGAIGTHQAVVWRWLKRHRIPTRGVYAPNKGLLSPRRGKSLEDEYGLKRAKEIRKHLSRAHKGVSLKHEGQFAKGSSPWNKGTKGVMKTNGGSFRKGLIPWNKGRTNVYSEETLDRIRAARRGQQIPTSLTKPERAVRKLVREYHLAYKYTGDGSFWIGAINPDFVNVNGEKIALEVFGDYWHSTGAKRAKPDIPYRQTLKGRRAILKRYGWQLIVLWESEINTLPEDELVKKISVNVPYAIVKGGASAKVEC